MQLYLEFLYTGVMGKNIKLFHLLFHGKMFVHNLTIIRLPDIYFFFCNAIIIPKKINILLINMK